MQQFLSSGQQQVVSNLLRVRAMVKASRARMEQQRTHEFLNACSGGNLERMRMVSQSLERIGIYPLPSAVVCTFFRLHVTAEHHPYGRLLTACECRAQSFERLRLLTV
jgi:hypothetical protein